MISHDKRKEVFRKYFLNFNTQGQICKEMNISKGSVTKIIKECRTRIEELGLLKEEDLSAHIEKIVTVPIRKKRQYPRLVVTDKHEKIIEKMVINNEKNRTRIGQKGSHSRANLYLKFESVLEDYNDAIRSMHRWRAQKQKTPSLTEVSLESTKKYNEVYDIYSTICDEYDFQKEFKDPLDNEIYVISSETFYRVARKIKRDLFPTSYETENESSDSIEDIKEYKTEIEIVPPKFMSEGEKMFLILENTFPPKRK